mgnify:CR=1 FL=1
MTNEPKILNFEKVLEILDIIGEYIDENNEIKPEFFVKEELLARCISIFSGSLVKEFTKEDVLEIVTEFDNYVKVNEILEANKIVKNFGLR